MSRDDLLFYQNDLDATLRAHVAAVRSKVDSIPKAQFMTARAEEIVEHLSSEMAIDPLEIYEDRAEMEQAETKIDVSAWRDRNPFGDAGPIYVAGVAITVTIPYSGDGSL